MNEWGVVGVIVVLVGLYFTIYNPAKNNIEKRENNRLEIEKAKLEMERRSSVVREENTKAITELTTKLSMFVGQFEKTVDENREDHSEIYRRLNNKKEEIARHDELIREHSKLIDEHESRINEQERRIMRMEENINGNY